MVWSYNKIYFEEILFLRNCAISNVTHKIFQARSVNFKINESSRIYGSLFLKKRAFTKKEKMYIFDNTLKLYKSRHSLIKSYIYKKI